MANETTYYGWYSPRQAEAIGTWIYQNAIGRQFEVSSVSQTLEHGCSWPGVTLVGSGLIFVRRARRGQDWFESGPKRRESEYLSGWPIDRRFS
jgi:hypothetical protein